MTKTTLSRSEQKRAAIIAAAKAAFKEYGVDATSMDKLAEIAQVSKRTVYNHFASKESLVLFLLTDLWNQAMVDSELNIENDQSLQSQLITILREEVDLVGGEEYIDLARAAFAHYLYQPDALQKEMEKFSPEKTALFQWLERAKSDQCLDLRDTENAFSQLHNLIKGACFWPQLMRVKAPLNLQERETLVNETVALFLSHYQTK